MRADLAILLAASVVGLLGMAHLVLTYMGRKLLPRDRTLQSAMEAVAPRMLFSSGFVQVVGVATLSSYVILAWRYWFITPLVGTSLALLLFVGGLVAGVMP
ncbi:MAG: hypothetical protein KJZ74_15355 [Gemmatimonadales bacterium]|nr:hypothetical protein [Gemmatimonadota bacterium]MCL4215281.1 hypothetical protein [Gemmatimonadales bacterium]